MHTELQKTVDDLAVWLSVVEQGLGSVLDTKSMGSVAEEDEYEAYEGGLAPPHQRSL